MSTVTARFVHGAYPLVSERLAMGRGRDTAYIAREELADATGYSPSLVVAYCKRQQAEVGIVTLVSHGWFGRVVKPNGDVRGEANGYSLDEDAPQRHVPVAELETEPYRIDIDETSIAAAMRPNTWRWAKAPRPHRLAMVLLHHAGLNRVRLTVHRAAELMGRGRVTGWRALKDLEGMGLAVEDPQGWWVDLSPCFYDASMAYTAPELEQRRQDHMDLRAAAFTDKGRELATAARIARDVAARLRGLGVAPTEFSRVVGRSIRQAVLWHLREARDRPGAWGSGWGPEDFKMLGWY